MIDDWQGDRELLCEYGRRFLKEKCYQPQYKFYQFENGRKFLENFEKNFYDIIFIDCYMEYLSGLETAYEIRKLDRKVTLIFSTASRDFAMEGYQVQAAGYLVKPIHYEDFVKCLDRIDMKKMEKQQFIEINAGQERVKIPVCDILYCESSGHYVQIHTKHLGIQRVRMAFQEFCQLMKPYGEFVVCCRGGMVNLNYVKNIDEEVINMKNGERIVFSRRRQEELTKAYTDFIFDKVRNQKL